MSTMNASSLQNEENMAVRWKTVKRQLCSICDGICSSYNHYGAKCCEACKQFFRRMVVQRQNLPRCLHNSNCDVKKVRCRHCRYQKCLLLGMDQKSVEIKSAEKYGNLIESLKRIDQSYKKIWDSSQPLPEAYTNRHQTLAGLLQDNYNLMANADQFPEESTGCWNKAEFINELEANGLFSMNALSMQYVKDWFQVAELAKSFAFIGELCLDDQIVQVNHIRSPVRILVSSFYSHSVGAKCVTRKNGLESTAFLEAKQIRGDQRIRTLYTECSCRLVEKMSEVDLNYDEYLLLLAILLSNSNADGLSQIGRKKLYNHSIHYARILQKMLQCKFGPIGGAQKFASLIDLMNFAFRRNYKLLEMFTYLEVFYERRSVDHAYPMIMHSKDAN